MLISTRCIRGFMSNSIKKSLTVSSVYVYLTKFFEKKLKKKKTQKNVFDEASITNTNATTLKFILFPPNVIKYQLHTVEIVIIWIDWAKLQIASNTWSKVAFFKKKGTMFWASQLMSRPSCSLNTLKRYELGLHTIPWWTV